MISNHGPQLELVKTIYNQSLKHRFKMLRNGKEDTNTGLPLRVDDFMTL